jgi:ubiquinone biosynthesis O-methyltransferase
VIEHVVDPKDFVRSILRLAKPGGKVIFSTINRTSPSYLLAIVAAEKVLGLMDNGTHDWNKFVTPEELSNLVLLEGGKVEDITGLSYNPISHISSLTLDSSVNYFLCASKV